MQSEQHSHMPESLKSDHKATVVNTKWKRGRLHFCLLSCAFFTFPFYPNATIGSGQCFRWRGSKSWWTRVALGTPLLCWSMWMHYQYMTALTTSLQHSQYENTATNVTWRCYLHCSVQEAREPDTKVLALLKQCANKSSSIFFLPAMPHFAWGKWIHRRLKNKSL